MGRFLTRDTWGGDASKPMSYNKWLFAYSNAIRFTDPTGMYPVSACEYVPPVIRDTCLMGSGILKAPIRAAQIQNNLWAMKNYTQATKADSPQNWSQFTAEYKTRWNAWVEENCDVWWLTRKDKSFQEIILGIYYLKEMRFVVNEPDNHYMIEALARDYWEECGSGYCGVSSNWTASNSLLNVLDYSESMTKLTPLDSDLVFAYQEWPGQDNQAPKWNAAINIASSVINGYEGTLGKDNNRPYHYFCTNCTNGASPRWLIQWLNKHYPDVRNPGYDRYNPRAVVYIYGAPGSGVYNVILTPNQTIELCGWTTGTESSCISPSLLEPPWVKEDLKGLK